MRVDLPVVLGFDVGGTTVKAAAYDTEMTLLAETRRPSRHGPAILDVVNETASQLRAQLTPDQDARVVGAGVAMLGIVDVSRGVVVRSGNLDLNEFPVTAPLTERLALPVTLGHDVRAAAEAERRFGFAAAVDPFVMVIGTGISGVAYLGGRILRGSSGQAGEIGHVVVRPGGPLCACGNRGCLEAVASAGAIARSYTQRTGTSVDGALEVLARDDADARAVWAEATTALADALLTMCALLAPGVIVLGGGLADAGAALTGPVTAAMRERAGAITVPPVKTATLGARAGVVGAALLAIDAL